MVNELDRRLRALASPHRLRILGIVTGRAVSAAEVSRATGLVHAAASYHLRQLATAGLIELVDRTARRPARGRPQQRYRMRHGALSGLGRSELQVLDRGLLSEIERRLREARTTRTVTHAEVWLGPRDRRRLDTLLQEIDALVHERAATPRTRGSAHLSVTTLLFERKT